MLRKFDKRRLKNIKKTTPLSWSLLSEVQRTTSEHSRTSLAEVFSPKASRKIEAAGVCDAAALNTVVFHHDEHPGLSRVPGVSLEMC